MDKRHFMRELTYHLRELPSKERSAILQDYEDHFKIAEIDGKDEQSVILELGTPRQIAQARLVDMEISDLNKQEAAPSPAPITSNRRPGRSFSLLVLLILLNVIFVLGPAVAIFGVWIGLWGIAVAFVLSPIAWLVSLLWSPLSSLFPDIFIMLTMVGSGLLLAIVMVYVSRGLTFISKRYITWHIHVIKGG